MATRNTGPMDGLTREAAIDWLRGEQEAAVMVIGLTGHEVEVTIDVMAHNPYLLAACRDCNKVYLRICLDKGGEGFVPMSLTRVPDQISIATAAESFEARAHMLLGVIDDLPF